MTETGIVNRTPESFGQKTERERLEAEAVLKQVVPLVKTLSENPTVVEALADQGLQLNKEVLAELAGPPDTPFLPGADLISEALKIAERNRKTEFNVFRDQVIAAFKHLGLDTRKFFGV
jgi:hypothetical protein